ncbi:MAG: Fic family protein [Epsilonproteobacteria bacterium]|nr:Fic family protein [Campylobacterota bacterium]
MKLISDEINKIETNKLSIFKPNTELAFYLAKKDKIDFVYNTSALEGNAMTYPEVQTLLEGVTVGGHKLSDEQQILNQNKSVDYLFELIENKSFNLDIDTFTTLHSFVAKEEALKWGVFRESSVNIGGTDYEVPHADLLENIFIEGMEEIKKIHHPIIKAITMFLFGAKCQFFYDGNKRTSRLMMNGILIEAGYPILNIKAKDRLEFNSMMVKFYDGDYITPSIEYLVDYYIEQNRKFEE